MNANTRNCLEALEKLRLASIALPKVHAVQEAGPLCAAALRYAAVQLKNKGFEETDPAVAQLEIWAGQFEEHGIR